METKQNYKLPPLQDSFCSACYEAKPVYPTYGLTGDAYDCMCSACLDKILTPLAGKELKNCIKCKALLLDDGYYELPEKKAYCLMCQFVADEETRKERLN